MNKPKRPTSHIINTKSQKYLERYIPDEWTYQIPSHDYGIDYQVEIAVNGEVTGLNFSIQLKGHEKGSGKKEAKATINRSTIGYYKVRLEPIMIAVYEDDVKEAYWTWLDDVSIDLSKPNKSFSIPVPKKNKLSALNWDEVRDHVLRVFNNRSFISDFDISKIHDNLELAAWKVYHEGNYEQAAYLFRQLIAKGCLNPNVHQALSWSLYQTARYSDALELISKLLLIYTTDNLLQMKACILAEFGISTSDKGKVLQAQELFKQFAGDGASATILYNYGNTLSALGEFEQAILQYEASLDKDPNFAPGWKNLGTAYGSIGNHEQELQCYDRALAIDPNLREALFSKGITLAKDFQRYKDALIYFEQLLNGGTSQSSSFISGLYWVSVSYDRTGDLAKALYWADYGLSFAGGNPYLLRLKTDLLADNWKKHPELKAAAEQFFKYRVSLNGDGRSLNHLIRLQGLSFSEAYPLLAENSPIFRNAKLASLQAIGFDLEIALTTLLYLQRFAAFKKDHLVTRYVGHLISPYFSVAPEFWDLLDAVCVYAFNSAIMTYTESRSAEKMCQAIAAILIDLVPKLVPYLIERRDDLDAEEIEMTKAIVLSGLTTIVYREMGAQSGILTYQLKTAKVEPEEYIRDEPSKRLAYNILVALHYFFEGPSAKTT